MQIWIVRHGLALDIGQSGITRDSDRPLSKEGRTKTREVAEGLLAMKCIPDAVASSPLVRAQQTAEIIAGVLCPGIAMETADVLAPGHSPVEVIDWLSSQTVASIMLVGHLPGVSQLASMLVAGMPEGDIEFKKAGVCSILTARKIVAGQGTLEWLMPPRILRSLANGPAR